jgi:hypothetical protein
MLLLAFASSVLDDLFDFINNSHRTDPKENATAA